MEHAADDWLTLAKEAEQAARDIYDNGSAALNEHWVDEVGEQAGRKLKDLANLYEVAAAELRSVVMTLDGLSTAAELAQTSLHSAVSYATNAGLIVHDDGTLQVPVEIHNDPDIQAIRSQASRLIDDAVTEATKIDKDATDELNRLKDAVGNTDLDKALNDIQATASQNELTILADSIPRDADPTTVAAWWNGLTPEQRDALKKALPVQIYDLDGIPETVKNELKGNLGYDRVELVRWAQKHWDDKSIDIFDNNCTQFVSAGLEHAGMKQKMSPWTGTFDDDGWGHGTQTGWGWLDRHDHSHSASWANAEANRDFMVNHGGQTVPLNQAKPGDIVYFEQNGPDGPTDPGKVHHAAIVTSVTPDGDIHYTQHTDSRLNVSLDGRLPHNEITEGDQNIVIVRPNPNY